MASVDSSNPVTKNAGVSPIAAISANAAPLERAAQKLAGAKNTPGGIAAVFREFRELKNPEERRTMLRAAFAVVFEMDGAQKAIDQNHGDNARAFGAINLRLQAKSEGAPLSSKAATDAMEHLLQQGIEVGDLMAGLKAIDNPYTQRLISDALSDAVTAQSLGPRVSADPPQAPTSFARGLQPPSSKRSI